MRPKEAIGEAERRYLRTIWELAGGSAKTGVSYAEIQERLALSDNEAEDCCEYWVGRWAIRWSAVGHVSLTRLGLVKLEQMGTHHASRAHVETLFDGQEHGSAEGRAREPRMSVSVVIPVVNEAKTIDRLVRLAQLDPLVNEVLVVNDGSTDGTAEIASRAGAKVVMSSFLGKGASMRDGIEATTGDVVLFLDGDLLEVCDDIVQRMVDPIIDGRADLVKARFTRDAGRVTVLTARPLLGAFFPELGEFDQPLGGIVAVRRSRLGSIRLENDYGVDVGLLIDAVVGGSRAVEVDIGWIEHESQSLEALGQMAKQVTRVILDRAWRNERLSINQVRELEEMERRSAAELLPTVENSGRAQKVALFDMDGVLLDGRFAVELANRIDARSELSRFLDNRSLSEEDRTRLIAALLTGVPRQVFEETALSMPLMHGAVETVVALRKAGYRVGIVTDSFHVAAEIVRRRVFADFCVANIMHFQKGLSTGEITPSPAMLDSDGCRLHSRCKSNVIHRLRETEGLLVENTLAVGDGENDICMLKAAGLSVAFRPKSNDVGKAATHMLDRSLLDILDVLSLTRPSGATTRAPISAPQFPTAAPISVRADWSSRRAHFKTRAAAYPSSP